MRAIFFDSIENLGPGLSTVVDGERAKHLIKSARIQQGENILLMDGRGSVAEATVSEVLKKEVVITVNMVRYVSKEMIVDLLICLPKKDAFEDILRSSVEVGVSKIIPCYSEYSQQNFKFSDRYQRILESGIIQSNNPHAPTIESPMTLQDLESLSSFYDNIIYFSSKQGQGLSLKSKVGKILLVIGPEGGLSEEEEQFLNELNKAKTLHINCPIMRAPTAFNVGVGYLFGVLEALDQ